MLQRGVTCEGEGVWDPVVTAHCAVVLCEGCEPVEAGDCALVPEVVDSSLVIFASMRT